MQAGNTDVPSEAISRSEPDEAETRITMDLLQAVHSDGQASQRSLAARLNIALGLTNAYLKRCVRKGLVKVQRIPPNRYAYYLTPTGFREKSRLTASYLFNSFQFYREARNACDDLLREAADNGARRVALAGAGELAEIAILCAMQYELEVAGVVDSKSKANRFRHLPLVGELESLGAVDIVLVTDVARPQRTFEFLRDKIGAERVLTPDVLKIARDATTYGEGGARQ